MIALSNTESAVLHDIMKELRNAESKHPSMGQDMVHRAAVVSEESGELVRATLMHHYEKGKLSDVRKEAVQTAAMAIRFILELQEG